MNCFTLSLKCFLWLRQLSDVGIRLLLQFPHPLRAGPVLLTLLFRLPSPSVPLSYPVLHESIYSLPLVRYSCLLSAGVMHTLLCLQVYSWCIHGERCTSHPPTPPPSCSPRAFFKMPFLPKELSTFSSLGYWKVHRVKRFGTAARRTVAVHHSQGIPGDKSISPVDTTE